jgi:hypothetical protein
MERGNAMAKAVAIAAAFVAGTSLLFAAPVPPHHAFAAAYDESKPINLEGTVTNVELVNPHSWIWMDVTDADGSVTNWGMEGGPPLNLIRNGVTKNTLPIGSEIRIFGYQAKSGESKGVGVFFEYLDGRKIFMGGSAPGADGNPVPAAAPR